MSSWNDVVAATPDLAEKVRQRFDAHGLAILATLRADGFPRVSGIETLFDRGQLWLGMMDESLKALDLRRDPRCSLHSATVDKQVKDGDAKITRNAVEVTDEAAKREFMDRFREATGDGPPDDSPFVLFTVDVTELSFLVPAGDHLDITSWSQARGTRTIERY
jgi:hypothetical protein